MADADDLADSIAENLTAPKMVRIGGETVEQHPLPEQVAAAQFLANKEAGLNPFACIKRTRFIPGGTG